MNGYSKMKGNGNGNGKSSRSIDHFSPPDQSPYPFSEPAPPNPTPNNRPQPQPDPTNSAGQRDSLPEQEGISSGPKLRRNSSVSSAYALQAAVKRAFSMRRSSSVSDRYRRIHDQSATWETAPFDDEEEADDTVGMPRSAKMRTKKRSRGKILKAWKKLFGH